MQTIKNALLHQLYVPRTLLIRYTVCTIQYFSRIGVSNECGNVLKNKQIHFHIYSNLQCSRVSIKLINSAIQSISNS